MLASYARFLREPRAPVPEYVVICATCGEVVALRFGGQRVPDEHTCRTEKGEE